LTYAAHPEGVVEYEKRVWTERAERLLRRNQPPQDGLVIAASPVGTVKSRGTDDG